MCWPAIPWNSMCHQHSGHTTSRNEDLRIQAGQDTTCYSINTHAQFWCSHELCLNLDYKSCHAHSSKLSLNQLAVMSTWHSHRHKHSRTHSLSWYIHHCSSSCCDTIAYDYHSNMVWNLQLFAQSAWSSWISLHIMLWLQIAKYVCWNKWQANKLII